MSGIPMEVEELINKFWADHKGKAATKYELTQLVSECYNLGHLETTQSSRVNLTRREYDNLLDDSNLLGCLLVCGVEKDPAFAAAYDIYLKDKQLESDGKTSPIYS